MWTGAEWTRLGTRCRSPGPGCSPDAPALGTAVGRGGPDFPPSSVPGRGLSPRAHRFSGWTACPVHSPVVLPRALCRRPGFPGDPRWHSPFPWDREYVADLREVQPRGPGETHALPPRAVRLVLGAVSRDSGLERHDPKGYRSPSFAREV